jgi:hypothetical protein
VNYWGRDQWEVGGRRGCGENMIEFCMCEMVIIKPTEIARKILKKDERDKKEQ